jgi:MoaA/NifB/PqqE/SkfB family radical SAM enzyme
MSMINRNAFSVYNVHQSVAVVTHPLGFLLPEDRDHGWAARKNLRKPLNHLGLIAEKEQIAKELNLHNILTPNDVFDRNFRDLELHQKGELSSRDFIEKLGEQLRKGNSQLGPDEIIALLRSYAAVGSMEFHPSDACNLACLGCTYGHGSEGTKPPAIFFPFGSIRKIADLRPKGVTIVGGGEPALYKSGENSFPEMVDELSYQVPDAVLALITNGTLRPKGDWIKKLSWVRISLDAATEETYAVFRQRRFFGLVLKNYLDYLATSLEYVGISFLFSKANIHEYAKVAELIFDLVSHDPKLLGRTGIDYRPLRKDPKDKGKHFGLAIDESDIETTLNEVRRLAERSGKMRDFLKYQTNITAFLGGNLHTPHEFERCYYSQIFHIVRANGELRPCFVRVKEPDFILGNIIRDPLETIALNSLYIGARKKNDCDPDGCRQGYVNYVLAEGLSGKMKPSLGPDVSRNPLY